MRLWIVSPLSFTPPEGLRLALVAIAAARIGCHFTQMGLPYGILAFEALAIAPGGVTAETCHRPALTPRVPESGTHHNRTTPSRHDP